MKSPAIYSLILLVLSAFLNANATIIPSDAIEAKALAEGPQPAEALRSSDA
ncbi:hypothetical protein K435DRAFT_968885 [Dendrothele bispora CBS 962.96]|uniref:Uncharacterized protein n=1 Tax=Dendrothele bispora (strain CBS 962.96) TaxID=1314807 RepID=A0A4S8LL07_DENBC|nr:hypothetical protein K435DRAFT_968885 [Dendrothele bispora CBS 962.96]